MPTSPIAGETSTCSTKRVTRCLGEGRCLVALDRTREAAAVLDRARSIFVRLKAKPALAETDDLLVELPT